MNTTTSDTASAQASLAKNVWAKLGFGRTFFLRDEDERDKQNSRSEHTAPRAWRHQAPRAQKGHALLLLGHLVVPAAKLRTLSLPNKTTDCSTACNTPPEGSRGAQALYESLRFSGASSAHFTCNDHHPGPLPVPHSSG